MQRQNRTADLLGILSLKEVQNKAGIRKVKDMWITHQIESYLYTRTQECFNAEVVISHLDVSYFT